MEANTKTTVPMQVAMAKAAPPTPAEAPRSPNAAFGGHPDYVPVTRPGSAVDRPYVGQRYPWKSLPVDTPFQPEPLPGDTSELTSEQLRLFSRKHLKAQQRQWRLQLLKARWEEVESGAKKFLVSIPESAMKPMLVGGADEREAVAKYLDHCGIVSTVHQITIETYSGP